MPMDQNCSLTFDLLFLSSFFLNQDVLRNISLRKLNEGGKTSLCVSHDISQKCIVLLVCVMMASLVWFAEMLHLHGGEW